MPIPMLTLDDICHLYAAESWLERGDYLNCFDELERIDYTKFGARACASMKPEGVKCADLTIAN